MIVESEYDDIIPHPVIQNYVAAFCSVRSLTTRVIDGADHGLATAAAQRAYTALLLNWLTEMVVGARISEVAPHLDERVAARSAIPSPQPGTE